MQLRSNAEYINWLGKIKQMYRDSQIKASFKVNQELLVFYWNFGREMIEQRIDERWGESVVEQMSLDLKEAFPESKGFSSRNLWYIKQWYLFYSQSDTILQQLVAELQNHENEIPQQLVADFPGAIFSIPWGHNCMIVSKCKKIEEAAFYVRKTIENNWSRSSLEKAIDSNAYISQGRALTNFNQTLPLPQSQLAQEVLKDPYNMDFISLRADYDEKDLERALSHNIERFLLELGKGFAFVGRQVELRVSDTSYYIDMLFYHIRLKCYVVVELKVVDFKPEFAGKLNFYVNAVDNLLKQEGDNPTIGLLICRGKDKNKVEWSFKGIETPLGVAEYKLAELGEFHSSLPTIEEIEAELK